MKKYLLLVTLAFSSYSLSQDSLPVIKKELQNCIKLMPDDGNEYEISIVGDISKERELIDPSVTILIKDKSIKNEGKAKEINDKITPVMECILNEKIKISEDKGNG